MQFNMRLRLFLIFAVLRCLNAKSSTIGKEFYFGILNFADSCCHDSDNIILIDVTNVSPQETRIRVQIPYINNDTFYIIQTGQRQSIRIPSDIQIGNSLDTKASRGIRISSDNDVSLIVTNTYIGAYMDVYNILPTTSIGKTYKVISYPGDTSYGSSFLITGVYENTNVTFHTKGSVHSVLLNPLDILQYLCLNRCDLSGTLVTANKNISIIAGSALSDIGEKGRDYLASEMIPTSAWARSYIIPPLHPNPQFFIRTMSDHNSSITLWNNSHPFSFKPDLGDLYFEKLPTVMTSNDTFSIAQYGVRSHDNIGDLFETIVPGIDQYMNEYIFTVPQVSHGNAGHFLAIIVPLYQMNSTILDGQSVQSQNMSKGDIKKLAVPYPFDNYTVLTFETTEGVHHFWHPQRDVSFGVFVYGLGPDIGYGFYAGYDLEGKKEIPTTAVTTTTLKTRQTATTETTKATTTETTKATTETTKATTTTERTTETVNIPTVTTMLSKTEEHMCFSCTDLSHPGLCDIVQKCSHDEICYVESYIVSGQRKYRSGCKIAGVCKADHDKAVLSGTFCFDCCNTSYCNNQGCGEVIPDRNSRGPMCFHCDHLSRPEECSKVEPCGLHEACFIEAYTWFGETFHYKMGCDLNLCDTASRVMHTSHVVKRATLVCSHCCNDDFCNRNCTKASDVNAGPAIIG